MKQEEIKMIEIIIFILGILFGLVLRYYKLTPHGDKSSCYVTEKEELADMIAEKVNIKIKQDAFKDMAWEVFSTLGLEEIEKVVEAGYENRKAVGHTHYNNLAKVFENRLRGMVIKNLEDILRKLTEIHPK